MPYPNCTSCEINSGTCNPVMPVYPGGRAIGSAVTKPAGQMLAGQAWVSLLASWGLSCSRWSAMSFKDKYSTVSFHSGDANIAYRDVYIRERIAEIDAQCSLVSIRHNPLSFQPALSYATAIKPPVDVFGNQLGQLAYYPGFGPPGYVKVAGSTQPTRSAGMVGIVPQGSAHYPALGAPRGPGFQAYTKAAEPITYAAGPWRTTEPQKMLGRGDTSYQFASPSQVLTNREVVPPFHRSNFDPWERGTVAPMSKTPMSLAKIKSAGQVSVSISSGAIIVGLAAVAGAVWYMNKRR
jgi:hypothetical protein